MAFTIGNGVCCFTGHRDFEETATDRQKLLFQKLVNNLIGCGYTTFIAGGAIGFDTFAAEYILKKRAEGAPIRLELVIPCADQDSRWSFFMKRRYRRILKAADSVECLHEHYVDGCMQERNRRMVDKSAVCVAFCRKQSGGTFYTVKYAGSHGVDIYDLYAMDQAIDRL